MACSVIVYKVTRSPHVVATALSREEALVCAQQLYQASKVLAAAGCLAAATSVLVTTDELARHLQQRGAVQLEDRPSIVCQFGAF